MMRVRSGFTLLFILALLAGCSAAQETPAAPSSGKMKIMSGAFADGQTIPVEFTCDGVDANPTPAANQQTYLDAGPQNYKVTVLGVMLQLGW